jgi:hypothetical protein
MAEYGIPASPILAAALRDSNVALIERAFCARIKSHGWPCGSAANLREAVRKQLHVQSLHANDATPVHALNETVTTKLVAVFLRLQRTAQAARQRQANALGSANGVAIMPLPSNTKFYHLPVQVPLWSGVSAHDDNELDTAFPFTPL